MKTLKNSWCDLHHFRGFELWLDCLFFNDILLFQMSFLTQTFRNEWNSRSPYSNHFFHFTPVLTQPQKQFVTNNNQSWCDHAISYSQYIVVPLQTIDTYLYINPSIAQITMSWNFSSPRRRFFWIPIVRSRCAFLAVKDKIWNYLK